MSHDNLSNGNHPTKEYFSDDSADEKTVPEQDVNTTTVKSHKCWYIDIETDERCENKANGSHKYCDDCFSRVRTSQINKRTSNHKNVINSQFDIDEPITCMFEFKDGGIKAIEGVHTSNSNNVVVYVNGKCVAMSKNWPSFAKKSSIPIGVIIAESYTSGITTHIKVNMTCHHINHAGFRCTKKKTFSNNYCTSHAPLHINGKHDSTVTSITGHFQVTICSRRIHYHHFNFDSTDNVINCNNKKCQRHEYLGHIVYRSGKIIAQGPMFMNFAKILRRYKITHDTSIGALKKAVAQAPM